MFIKINPQGAGYISLPIGLADISYKDGYNSDSTRRNNIIKI